MMNLVRKIAPLLFPALLLITACTESDEPPKEQIQEHTPQPHSTGPQGGADRPPNLKAQGEGASIAFMTPKGETRTIEFSIDEGTQMSVDMSPDGQWILFDLLGHIYRLPSEGGEAICLTQGSGIALNFHPAWSPDGQQIAFVSDRSGQNNIWVMNADGSSPQAVHLDEKSRFGDPEWHPDGNSLVAVRTFPSPGRGWHRRNMTVAQLSLDGAEPTVLMASALGHFTAPTFSADGKYLYTQVAYSTWNGNGLIKAGHRIQRRDMDSGQVINVRLDEPAEMTDNLRAKLSSTTYAEDVPGDNPAELTPEPSPDGRYLVFGLEDKEAVMRYRGHEFQGTTKLMLRDLESGDERVLVNEANRDLTQINAQYSYREFPGFSWAPDGQSVIAAYGGKIHQVNIHNGDDSIIPFDAGVLREISGQVRSRRDIRDESFEVQFMQWPASSPDGSQLVFAAVGKLWILPLDGTGVSVDPKPLTTDMSPLIQLTPSWTPDGKHVVFATWDNAEGGHLWKVNANGGTAQRLTIEAAQYLFPSVSDDGEQMLVTQAQSPHWQAFTAPAPSLASETDSGGSRWAVSVMPAAGGATHAVFGVDSPRQATFGPDDRIVSYGQDDVLASFDLRSPYPGEAALAQVVNVRSVKADGSDPQDHAVFPPRIDFVGGTNRPLLSPDGRWVAFEAGGSVFVSQLDPASGIAAEVDPNPNAQVADRVRLGESAGIFHRWRNATTIEFMSGNTYVSYNAETGEQQSVDISLTVPRAIPSGKLALAGAKIITMGGEPVIEKGDLLIEGSRIVCVGECDISAADRVIDVSGKVIVPGFFDLHAHHTSEASGVITQHRPAAALDLAYGVTTIVDPATNARGALPLAEMIEAGVLTGPRTFSSTELVITQNYAWGDNLEITSEENAQYNASYRFNWGAIELKNYRLASRQQHQYLIEAARSLPITVTAEGGPLFADVAYAMDGQTAWEHLLAPLPLYQDAAQFFGQAGVHYSPTVIVAGHVNGSKEYFRQRQGLLDDPKYNRFIPREILEAQHKHLPDLPKSEFSFPIVAEGMADIIRAGGYGALGEHGEQFGIGTHWELWAYSEALTPMEALKVATLDGAHYVGLEHETGSLEAGKLADMIILNSDPLENIRNSTDIFYVLKAGNLYQAETLDMIWPDKRPFGPPPW